MKKRPASIIHLSLFNGKEREKEIEAEMAASYWDSSQRLHWELRKQQRFLCKEHPGLDLPSARKLQLFFCHFVQRLGMHLGIPQRIITTALIYFHRFYSRFTYWDHDPWIMMPSCVFLAAKVEENVLQGKLIVAATQQIAIDTLDEWPYTEKDIWEAEFHLLHGLDFYLIVHQPYRSLISFIANSRLETILTDCWAVVNDSFKTDLCLQHPPHIVALASILVAASMKDKATEAASWFATINIKMDEVWGVIEELLDLYNFWNSYQFPEAIQLVRDFDDKRNPLV